MMNLSQICAAVNGTISDCDDIMVGGISINTRVNCSGRIFVALKGENFDAHDYLDQARAAGADALMVEQDIESDLPIIQVASTHQALADLSNWWRSQFDIPVIGVTGSVGKTSVKEMLGSIFAQRGKGVVTQGNLNNEIGVPLTLMRLASDDLYAVIEMGMNNAGEIARITQMAKPTIALINNAAAAHLEGLGTIEAVADAKAEIFQGLSAGGTAVINNDDRFAAQWREAVTSFNVTTFALDSNADITADYVAQTYGLHLAVNAKGQLFDVELAVLGEHNARNALAAIAVAVSAGVSIEHIQQGLADYRPISGRLNVSHAGGVTLIDDTYNANPLSMLAAIKVLAQKPDSTLIIGDMAELGAAAHEEHRLLGQRAAELGVDKVLVCGEFAEVVADSFKKHSQTEQDATAFKSQAELIDYALANISSGVALVKGSRSAAMELVVDALTHYLNKIPEDQAPKLEEGKH